MRAVVRTERCVSLDVARCLFMLGVVLQHAFALCNGGLGGGRFAPYAAYIVVDCLTHPSVDGFTSLSGWFGVRCSLKRLFRLAALIVFCGILHHFIYEAGRIYCGGFLRMNYGVDLQPYQLCYQSFRYWYLGAYLKLLVLSILINPILGAISKLGKKWVALIALTFIGLSYLSLLWFPWKSHSPRTVVFVYIVVRFVMMLDVTRLMRENRLAHWLAGLGMALLFAEIALNAQYGWGLCSGNYANPLTILAGLSVVMYFSAINISALNIIGKFCKLIAPSMIAVYMLHWNLLGTFFKSVPQIVCSAVPWLHPVVAFVLCAVCAFAICTLIDLMRRGTLGLIRVHLPQVEIKSRLLTRIRDLYERRLS